MHKRELVEEAIVLALRTRRRFDISRVDAVSPIDLAEKLGIEVRLVDIASMEGIYISGTAPSILLSSMRPQGRRNFTCAHEIGHHLFSHGQRFDELTGNSKTADNYDPKEYLADNFASSLLMPRAAVDAGMRSRGIARSSPSSRDVYELASWLGVGYTTLVGHLEMGLGFISKSVADRLRRTSPHSIRSMLIGAPCPANVHLVTNNWAGRAVDAEVGDNILVPVGTRIEGTIFGRVNKLNDDQVKLLVEKSGIGRLSADDDDWSVFVRASRTNYVGRGCYRFEQEIIE